MFSIMMMELGLIFLGFAVLILAMRRYRRRQRQAPSQPLPPPFDMVQLRGMRAEGAISDAEFERLAEVNFKHILTPTPPPLRGGFDVLPAKTEQ
jgi:hypothetical protein